MKLAIFSLCALIVCVVALVAAFVLSAHVEKNRIGITSGLIRTGALDYHTTSSPSSASGRSANRPTGAP